METLNLTFRQVSRRWLLSVVACCLALVCAVPSDVSATVASEYQLKAVFLFNFTQFVDWPTEAFPDSSSPVVIGVLGKDPFGYYLDEAVRGETVNGRPLAVERYSNVNEIKTCHVLFVSDSEADRMAQILASLKGRSILTVSDADNFIRVGGVIRFATVANKVRLKINLDSAQAARLTISSKLLRPAEVVARNE